jgi:hypothetical protein
MASVKAGAGPGTAPQLRHCAQKKSRCETIISCYDEFMKQKFHSQFDAPSPGALAFPRAAAFGRVGVAPLGLARQEA